ncbi:MAG: NAD-dependent succinate-semialdehyde dehydrogenase [Planctomycetes bacterium]|nr:NAD-dependent succinate-semialdehyde dehydrogenase [Planctomycetota bacterium]
MIESPLLARIGGSIGGRSVASASGETFEVRNPATGVVLAVVPAMGETETIAAVESAEAAMRTVPPAAERRGWLEMIAVELKGSEAELARIISLEHGKPLKEAEAEVRYSAGFFRFFAGRIETLAPRVLEDRIRACRWTVHLRPAGVAGLIAPWNFPLAMIAKKLAPAMAAGCGVVARPSSLAPLSSIAVWNILAGLALPAARFNLVLGPAEPIATILCRHPAVRVISFTGSTEVGRRLIARTAPHPRRLTLELGGNAPFIVFPDADLGAAADALIANKFRAGGQTCVCANRVYVHADAIARFTDEVAQRVRALRVGEGLDPGTDIGPLIHRTAFDKVARHVRDALAHGARRIVGQDPLRPAEEWGAFYPPTVLVDADESMLIFREETFGPVVAIASFADEDEVVRRANGTPFGLAAYVFTADAERAERLIARLRAGHVGWNTGTGPTPEAPFGGMKESGFGREGGLEGLLEYVEPQVVACAGEPAP